MTNDFSLEGRVWEMIQEYKANPSDETAQKVFSTYSIYLTSKPEHDYRFELLTRYKNIISVHNKYRSQGI